MVLAAMRNTLLGVSYVSAVFFTFEDLYDLQGYQSKLNNSDLYTKNWTRTIYNFPTHFFWKVTNKKKATKRLSRPARMRSCRQRPQ